MKKIITVIIAIFTALLAANAQNAAIDTTDNHISIYPNPTTSMIFIESDGNGTVGIYNLKGEKVYSGNIVAGKNDIDIDSFDFKDMYRVGVYMAKITINGKIYTTKIVIK